MSRSALLAADRRYMTALIRRSRGKCERYECGATLRGGLCPHCAPQPFSPAPNPRKRWPRGRS